MNLFPGELTNQIIERLFKTTQLHDIGKTKIPYAIIQKWLRLFEQHSPIYKWNPGGLLTAKRSPQSWRTRGAPKNSFYAAFAS